MPTRVVPHPEEPAPGAGGFGGLATSMRRNARPVGWTLTADNRMITKDSIVQPISGRCGALLKLWGPAFKTGEVHATNPKEQIDRQQS